MASRPPPPPPSYMQRMTKNWSAMVALMFGAACGGSDGGASGIDTGKQLSALSASEIRALCEYMVDVGRERLEECGPPGEEETVAECTAALGPAAAQCSATVGQVEACFEAANAALPDCDADPEECELLERCD
jgi:hypothetical protein